MKRIRQALARLSGGSKQPPPPPKLQRSNSKAYTTHTSSTISSDRLSAVDTGVGALVLFDGLQGRPADEGVDIVFVHCLGGHRIGSWEKNGVCWPRDLLSSDIPTARIITWGYTLPNTESAWADISGQLSETLLKDVAKVRKQTSRNIILVGHGLGGLVIKEALTAASVDRVYGKGELGDLYPKTIGVMFLGTPHVSSGKQTLGEAVASVAPMEFPQASNQLLQLIKENNELFETQRSEFLLVSRDIQVVCVRERIPTPEAMMVPKAISSYQGPNVTVDDVRADHSNIAKFASRQDPGYFQLVGHISKLSQSTPSHGLEAKRVRNREILDALAFDTVGEADEHINPAWNETCSWILDGKGENESEADLHTWLASSGVSSVFWMSGKAGSGKSTLMKYAFHDPKVRECLEQWAAGGKLMMAAFFMHEGGNYVQKSREGIMRAVLYQSLSARPELIPICFPGFMTGPWPPPVPFNTIVNLSQAFYQFFAHESKTLRLCMFIDGLDEYRIADQEDHYSDDDYTLSYDGEDGDEGLGSSKYIQDSHKEIARLIIELAGADHVKLLVSSRELRPMEEAFSGVPRLRVHLRSEKSIAQYCADRLDMISPGLSVSQLSLCAEVARKSRGDILWARLAIDMLMEGSLKQLKTILDALPARLGGTIGLYMRKIESLHPEHQKQACRIFETVLRSHQPPSLITLAFAEEGYMAKDPVREMNSPLGRLAIANDIIHPHTAEDVKHICDRMEQRLASCCAGLLEAQADAQGTGKRVFFMHQTTKEFASRKDIWDKVLVTQPDKEDVEFSLISGCVRHLKCFDTARSPVQTWPKFRFEPEAWLLIANALRYADRIDSSKEVDREAYIELMDELDRTCHKAWATALKNYVPVEDPAYGAGGDETRRMAQAKKRHWANFEPMESGKAPRRSDFLALTLQAGLVNYVETKLKTLNPTDRAAKAQELLEYAVSPEPETKTKAGVLADSVSACESLTGNYKDFHRDMPDSRFLDILFEAGADASGSRAETAWLKVLKAGHHFFSRQSLAVLNLATGSSNSGLIQNRQRWVAAVMAMLHHGADPFMQIATGGESGGRDDSSAETSSAIDIIRDTLEGEPEYAIELVQIEGLVRGATGQAL